MTTVRTDIIERSSNIDVRKIDEGIKNPWRWEWLEKQVGGIYLRENIRKLSISGIAYCTLCCRELCYGSRGVIALVDHLDSVKHKNRLKLRSEHFALPGTGEIGTAAPYGLHPMYAAHALTAEVNLPQPSTPLVDRVCNNEAMLLTFMAEKSLPFSLAPDLINLIKELSKDKKALDRLSMHRTAASYKLRFGVAQTFKEDLFDDLRNTFFSLNIDETTSHNHQKIVTILVNYLAEQKQIVTKHLGSFSVDTVNSNSIFEGIKNVFVGNEVPWKNLMSVLLDSCNVMRGKKSGLETKLREECPHLLDIDGDSCHHAHNAAKQFSKPFSKHLENLISDIHNDFKWSPDLRAVLSVLCEILNIAYTMPQNFISFRWLSIYDAAQDLTRLFDALLLFYFSFLSSLDQTQFLHIIVRVYRKYEVSEEGKDKIRNLQNSLKNKLLTEAGKERKQRIVTKLFHKHLETKLIMAFFLSVLPLLQEYIKLFQSGSPLIHVMHDKQVELLKNFLGCFIKPEVLLPLGDSGKKIKQLDVSDTKNQMSSKNIFVGETCKDLINVAPKSCLDIVREFRRNTLTAYVACAKSLQNKMPVTNQFLKSVSSIDSWCRQHSLSLELMKKLPDHVKNVISSEEREQYDLEAHKYHVDIVPQIKKEDICAWWVQIHNSKKYPLLSKMALALLTCFHGPKVESSFSVMNSVITPGSCRMNVSTFDAIQSVKYELSAKKKSSIELFSKQNFLKDPVDRKLCKNMRVAAKRYKEEKLQSKTLKEERRKKLNIKKDKVLSKTTAKKIYAKAAKKQRQNYLKKINLDKQNNSVVQDTSKEILPTISVRAAKKLFTEDLPTVTPENLQEDNFESNKPLEKKPKLDNLKHLEMTAIIKSSTIVVKEKAETSSMNLKSEVQTPSTETESPLHTVAVKESKIENISKKINTVKPKQPFKKQKREASKQHNITIKEMFARCSKKF